MSLHKTSGVYKLSYIFLFAVIFIGILLFVIQEQLSGHISEICEYKGRETATNIVSKAVEEQLAEDDPQYISIIKDENGRISSVETNSSAVNQLQNRIKMSVNDALSDIENTELSIPIGTLSGITLLSGRGANIDLGVYQVGAVDTEIKSEFISAGVNQTMHKLSVEITVEISVIMPLKTEDIMISDEFLISETIIVGQVPELLIDK